MAATFPLTTHYQDGSLSAVGVATRVTGVIHSCHLNSGVVMIKPTFMRYRPHIVRTSAMLFTYKNWVPTSSLLRQMCNYPHFKEVGIMAQDSQESMFSGDIYILAVIREIQTIQCTYCFFFSPKQSFSVQLWSLCWNLLCRPGEPQTHRHPPVSAFRVLRFKTSTTTVQQVICFFLIYLFLIF